MDIGRYNLAWNDFQSCTTNSLKDLIAREEFIDVTIACDDDKQIKAHKVILSACSEFFRNILLKNTHQHPLIYLDNLKIENLQALISFMYHGETNIPQDMFTDFIKAAQKYKIKGLNEQSEAIPQARKRRRFQSTSSSIAAPSVNIKEEAVPVGNEEINSVEVVKNTIVDTLINTKTKSEEDDEDMNESTSDVQVELTQVDVVEPMDDSESGDTYMFGDVPSNNDNICKTDESDPDYEEQGGDFLQNENKVFSEEESDGDDDDTNNGSIEDQIEIESIVDRKEKRSKPDSDYESIGEEESSDDEYEEESEGEESSDEESLDDESDSDENELIVKEELVYEIDDAMIVKPDNEDEKLLLENNNKNIKKEVHSEDSESEFL